MAHIHFETYYAPMMITGSVLGCTIGGKLGDLVSNTWGYDAPGRLFLAGIALIIASPFYIGLYWLDYPYCFIMLFFGGFFGEMYFSMVRVSFSLLVIY